jgi:hypothetical protein
MKPAKDPISCLSAQCRPICLSVGSLWLGSGGRPGFTRIAEVRARVRAEGDGAMMLKGGCPGGDDVDVGVGVGVGVVIIPGREE